LKPIAIDKTYLANILIILNMQAYNTNGHDAGVVAYEIGKDNISIKFRDGSVYLYTNKSAGAAAIADMKALAKKGEGLTTYINQHVREHYQTKLK